MRLTRCPQGHVRHGVGASTEPDAILWADHCHICGHDFTICDGSLACTAATHIEGCFASSLSETGGTT